MKTVLVTGAQGGIGSSIVEVLTAAGHNVISVGRREANLSEFGEIEKLHDTVLATTPHIDWIVCAHGYLSPKKELEQLTPSEIREMFESNVLSIVFLAQLFLKSIPPGGGMISISSSAGLEPNGYLSVYSASKAALNTFMQAMARNRPEQSFYAICPGATNAPMRSLVAEDAHKQQSPAVLAELVADLISGKKEYKSGDVILVKDAVSTIVSQIGGARGTTQ